MLAQQWHFRLYVAGTSPRSQLAVANLRRLCETHLPGAYRIDVVDLAEAPQRAREQDILATPTLVRMLPPPVRRVVGDLSETDHVLAVLDIEPVEGPA